MMKAYKLPDYKFRFAMRAVSYGLWSLEDAERFLAEQASWIEGESNEQSK